MARFRFRLEASLQLAQQLLESKQKEYAGEMQHWQACVKACAAQRQCYLEALSAQREAGRYRPEELGLCQVYALRQNRRLEQWEAKKREQEIRVAKAREALLEAHRDAEKYERLKEKQIAAFQKQELAKEQKVLDETGQVLHWLGRMNL